MALTKF